MQEIDPYREFRRSLRFATVVPGRKPTWTKKEEEWANAIESIAIVTGKSYRTVQSMVEQASLMYSRPSVPAIHRNLFRDFYFCVVKKYDIYPRDHIFDAFNRLEQYGHQRGANVNCFFDEYKDLNTDSLTLPVVSNPYKSVLYVSDDPDKHSKNWII